MNYVISFFQTYYIFSFFSTFLKNNFILIWFIFLTPWLYFFFKGLKQKYIKNNSITINFSQLTLKNKNKNELILFTLLVSILIFYLILMLYKSTFSYIDFIKIMVRHIINRNHLYPPYIKSTGRFFPLGHQEWNIFHLLRPSPKLVYLFTFTQLVFLLILLYFFLKKTLKNYFFCFFLISIILLTNKAFVLIFFGLIYPERMLIILFLLFLFAFYFYKQKPTIIRLSLIVITTQIGIYYKETGLLLFGGLCFFYLILSLLKTKSILNKNVEEKNLIYFLKTFNVELFIFELIFLFLFFYMFSIFPIIKVFMTKNSGTPFLHTLRYYTSINKWLYIYAILIIFRIIFLLLKKEKPHTFWDSLGLTGILYFTGFLLLGLKGVHYILPTFFIFIIYLVFIFSNFKKKISYIGILIICFLLQVIDINYSSRSIPVPEFVNTIIQFKEDATTFDEVVNFLKDYQKNNHPKALNLYFDKKIGWYKYSVMRDYLMYKGVYFYDGKDYPGQISSSIDTFNESCYIIKDKPNIGELVIVIKSHYIEEKKLFEKYSQKYGYKLLFKTSYLKIWFPNDQYYGYVFLKEH